jgi:hypothetical protein
MLAKGAQVWFQESRRYLTKYWASLPGCGGEGETKTVNSLQKDNHLEFDGTLSTGDPQHLGCKV